MDEYILMAKEKHGYNVEQVGTPHSQNFTLCAALVDAAGGASWSHPRLWRPQALGMLLWHKHDVERSLADLANFTPFPEEWSTEDKVMFEQAFGFHGKSFHRIQQMVRQRAAQNVGSLSWSHGKPVKYFNLKCVFL